MDGAERLAYDLALRALDQQTAALAELRSRTGTLLAASSVSASFLGAPVLRAGLAPPVVLALMAFGAVVALSLTVLRPDTGLFFGVEGPTAYEALHGLDPAERHRHLAYWLETCRARNQPTIDRHLQRFEWACAALGLETLLLALALAVT
jgi:hypothetical protein